MSRSGIRVNMDAIDSLGLAVVSQPKPPCDDTGTGLPCQHKNTCAKFKHSCQSFFWYTEEPMNHKRVRGRNDGFWLGMIRSPNASWYSLVYEQTRTSHKGTLPKGFL